MALVVKDRVKETTTTTGTGSISLGGAVTKFKTFSSALSDGDTTYYAIEQEGDTNEFEVGIGTYASSGNTLARTTILSSSNSNNAVDFSAGTKNVFITYPADKAVYEDASNNISVVDDAKIKFLTRYLIACSIIFIVPNVEISQECFSERSAIGSFATAAR